MFRRMIAAAILSAVACVCSAAPLTFNNVDGAQTRIVDFDGNVATQTVVGLTAQGTFSLLSISPDEKTWNFEVIVSETGVVDARVSALGFIAITPVFVGGEVTSDGGTGWNFTASGGFPNQFPSIVACLIDNVSTCAGGGGGGVDNGGTATVLFSLTFADATESVTFDGLGVRYQSIVGQASGSGTGTGGDPRLPPEETVPEPSTYALIGGALVGLQLLRKRK